MEFPQIISGGQTGAERAALDWALANGIRHGGWCPKGRKAEDGRISNDYGLKETSNADATEQTEKNVVDSDGTAVFTVARKLERDLQLSVNLAQQNKKPWLHIHTHTRLPVLLFASFIQGHRISRLHVTGSRASNESGVGHFVGEILTHADGYFRDCFL